MSKEEIVNEVSKLVDSPVRETVEERMAEFRAVGEASEERWFKELCFCILTANFTAEGGIRIQEAVGDGFLTLTEEELAGRLRGLGHRFPNARAGYIVEARSVLGELKDAVQGFDSGKMAREWLLDIKGLGMKEASHFLRNVGRKDVAIIDRHIQRMVFEHCMHQRCFMNEANYLSIEKELEGLAEVLDLDLARLDLYLWFMQTGKVLK